MRLAKPNKVNNPEPNSHAAAGTGTTDDGGIVFKTNSIVWPSVKTPVVLPKALPESVVEPPKAKKSAALLRAVMPSRFNVKLLRVPPVVGPVA